MLRRDVPAEPGRVPRSVAVVPIGIRVGSLLLEPGLALANEHGLKTIVLAKNPAVGLYERHGFRLVKRVSQERPHYGWKAPYVTSILVRDPIQ